MKRKPHPLNRSWFAPKRAMKSKKRKAWNTASTTTLSITTANHRHCLLSPSLLLRYFLPRSPMSNIARKTQIMRCKLKATFLFKHRSHVAIASVHLTLCFFFRVKAASCSKNACLASMIESNSKRNTTWCFVINCKIV